MNLQLMPTKPTRDYPLFRVLYDLHRAFQKNHFCVSHGKLSILPVVKYTGFATAVVRNVESQENLGHRNTFAEATER